MFHRPDRAEAAAAMPVFDGRGIVLPAPLSVLVTTTPVDVSYNESRGEEEEDEEEEEEHDLEATREGVGETPPLRKADILYTLPDDDDEADVSLE